MNGCEDSALGGVAPISAGGQRRTGPRIVLRIARLAAGERAWILGASGGAIGSGFVPYVADAQDAYAVVSPSSSASDRWVGGISLGINAWTAGLAPNAIPILRGADDVYSGVRGLGDAILGGRYGTGRAANVGGEVHHMPAASVSPLSRNQGPAIPWTRRTMR
jgi:hypothetical protein